ncbi:MAG TPA: NADPH:quinone reductase [Candidatus Binatia bacterium]|nr:NADPH:quinone reductase [Candidatus Binatia bacterium]
MKAIRVERFGGPEVLVVRELPDPVAGAGQVVVRIHAAGVNPVDTYIRSAAHGYAGTPLPYTPGIDGAGTIESIGPDVTTVAVGQRVYLAGSLSGTYAERALCAAGQVHPLPDHTSFAQGAAVGVPYATAYRALFQRGGLRPGEALLVHGASGAVGTAAVQLARALGARVIGSAGSEDGLAHVRREGAHHAVDHRKPGYLEEVRSHTGGRGVDMVVEMLADVNLAKDFEVLARYGRIVIVGSRGSLEFEPRLTMRGDADVRGMSLFNATPAELTSIHAALYAGLEAGTLRPVVGKEFPLADAPKAHEAVMEAGAQGKIVLVT